MATAFYQREIIALLRRDIAKTRASAYYVNDHAWQFCSGQIRHALLHQAHAGSGGGRHHPLAGRSRAIHHVDGRNFAFRLDERPADLGYVKCRVFGDFTGGSDGVSVVGATSGEHCAFHDGYVAFTQLSHSPPPVPPSRSSAWDGRDKP